MRLRVPANVTSDEPDLELRILRHAHMPIIAASALLDEPVTVPWPMSRRGRGSPFRYESDTPMGPGKC